MANEIILRGEGIDSIFAQLQQVVQLFQTNIVGQLPTGKYNNPVQTNTVYSIKETIKKLGITKPTYYKYREELNLNPIVVENKMVHTEEHIQKFYRAIYPNLQMVA